MDAFGYEGTQLVTFVSDMRLPFRELADMPAPSYVSVRFFAASSTGYPVRR